MAGSVVTTYQDVLSRASSQQLATAQSRLGAQEPARKPASWLSALPSLAAAGASFIPGVGTAAAAGLGGVGEGLRQSMAGEGFDFNKVMGEAALSAIPGGLGKLSKLGKGARVAEDVVKPNLLQRFSKNTAEQVSGVKPGAKAVGQEQLGVQQSDDLNTFLDSLPEARGKAPREALAAVERYHAGWGKQLGDVISQRNIPLTPTSITTVKDRIMARLGEIAKLPATEGETALLDASGKAILKTGAGQADHALVKTYLTKLGEIKDLKGLNKLRQKIDDDINFGRKAATPDPLGEQVGQAFRGGIAESISEAVPEVKPLNELLTKSYKSQDFLKNAAGKTPGGGMNLLGFFGGPKVGGTAMQTATAKAGQLAGQAGDAVAGGSSLLQFGKSAVAQGATRGGAALLGADVGAPNQPGVQPEAMAGASAAPSAPQPSDGLLPPEVMQGLYQQALKAPTLKEQREKIAFLNELMDTQDKLKSSKPKKLTEAQAARGEALDLARSASDQLANGNIKTGMIAAPLEDIKAKFGMGDQKTLDFNTTASALRAAIAKARSGSALTATEISLLNKYVPKTGDSRQELETKLNGLMGTLQAASTRDSGGAASEDVLAGLASGR